MREAAEVSIATHTIQIEVSTRLGLVITVFCSDVIKAWKGLRYWFVLLSDLSLSVCERASVTKRTGVAGDEVSTEPSLVLDQGKLGRVPW